MIIHGAHGGPSLLYTLATQHIDLHDQQKGDRQTLPAPSKACSVRRRDRASAVRADLAPSLHNQTTVPTTSWKPALVPTGL